MTSSAWGLLALFLTLLLMASWPLGIWVARLCAGNLPGWMHKIEAPLYRLASTSPGQSMNWSNYALALLAFNLLGALVVYGLQRLQLYLPLNPAGIANVSADSAFNTAVSFVTNTNWQGYAGESTMSYLTQMLGLAVQNFLSAAMTQLTQMYGPAVPCTKGEHYATAIYFAVGNCDDDVFGGFWRMPDRPATRPSSLDVEG